MDYKGKTQFIGSVSEEVASPLDRLHEKTDQMVARYFHKFQILPFPLRPRKKRYSVGQLKFPFLAFGR